MTSQRHSMGMTEGVWFPISMVCTNCSPMLYHLIENYKTFLLYRNLMPLMTSTPSEIRNVWYGKQLELWGCEVLKKA